MQNLLDEVVRNNDTKLNYIKVKLNKLNNHLVYMYLMMIINCVLTFTILLRYG